MKKRCVLISMVILAVTFGMTQNVMAKKIVYLGHQYDGKVNSKNIPEGKGSINVNGLIINGTFNASSVTDAEVHRTYTMGAVNKRFHGEVTFDTSEDIVLKAGGTISTKYYYDGLYNHTLRLKADPSWAHEKLTEDRVVNSSNFESQKARLSCKRKIDFQLREMYMLEPPEVDSYYTVDISHVTEYQGQSVEMDAYITTADDIHAPDKLFTTTGFEDEQGRLWDYICTGQKDIMFSVKYPNGNMYQCADLGTKNISAEIHFPDGKTISVFSKYDDHEYKYNLGRLSVYESGTAYTPGVFMDDIQKESFAFREDTQSLDVCSDSIDLEKLSKQEMVKMLQENLLPYLTTDMIVNVYKGMGNRTDDNWLGQYKSIDNSFYSRADRDAKIAAANAKANAEKAKQAAAEKAAYQQLCREFGKNYVDAAQEGKVIIGMPEKLFVAAFKTEMKSQTRTSKCYRVYGLGFVEGIDGYTLTNRNLKMTVWVSQGRVSKIIYH